MRGRRGAVMMVGMRTVLRNRIGLIGMAGTAVVIGKLLGMVNRVHMRVTGRLTDKRDHTAWNRSMRGERRVTHDRGVLEQVMLISVGSALVLFGIWFFAFAGSSLPT